MLKKIHVRNLRVGMYVHDLGRIWMDHPFAMSCFLVKELQTIRKITDAGIREVVIDSTKGLDVRQSAKASVTRVSSPPAKQDVKPDRVRVSEEQGRARVLFQEATQIIRNLMRDARLGKQVELQSLEPLAARMVQSSLRSRHALTGISRIKTKDEFEVMRRHVEFSGRFLQQQVGLSPVAKEVAMLHHERMDGKGYPLGLKGQQISRVGQMAAIVDVYDALTSVRVYKAAWEPSLTLKKLLEWSPHHFNPQLVQRFIKCLGIYPVGSLVELESGRVGVVMEQGQDMLRPLLRIVYHATRRAYVQVQDLDMARETSDRIVNVRSPADFKLDLSLFV